MAAESYTNRPTFGLLIRLIFDLFLIPMISPPEQNAIPALPAAVEEFLGSVELKSTSVVHRRLLKAARSPDPLVAMSAELAKVASEITNET